jgi:hypothetical protein
MALGRMATMIHLSLLPTDKKVLAVNNPVKAQNFTTHNKKLRYTITEIFTARKSLVL